MPMAPTMLALEPSAMTRRPALAASDSAPAVTVSSRLRSPPVSVRLKAFVPAATLRRAVPAADPIFSQLSPLAMIESMRGVRISKASVAVPMPAAESSTVPAASTFQLDAGSPVLPSSSAPPALRRASEPAPVSTSSLMRMSPELVSVALSAAVMRAALLMLSAPELSVISAVAPLMAPLRLRSPLLKPSEAVPVADRLATSTPWLKLRNTPPALPVAVSTLLVSSSMPPLSLSAPMRAALRLILLPAVVVFSRARSVAVVASRMAPPAVSTILPARLVMPASEISPLAVIARSAVTVRLAALPWVRLPAATPRLIALARTLPVSVRSPALWLKLPLPEVSSEPSFALRAEERLKPVLLLLVSVASTEAMAAASRSKSSLLLPMCFASSDSSPLVSTMLASVSPLELSRMSPPATRATAPSAPESRARWMSPEALRLAVPLTLIVLPLVCTISPLAAASTSEPALTSPASSRSPRVTCRLSAPVTLAASSLAPPAGSDSRKAAPSVVVTDAMRPVSRSMSAVPLDPMLFALRLRLPAVTMLASSSVVRSTM